MDSILKSASIYPASLSEHKITSITNLSTPSKRRPRHRLSCAECRRLKLKCDRTWPCSSCTKRGCARICPDGTLQSKVRTKDTSALLARISELENLVQQKEHQLLLGNNSGSLNDGPDECPSTSRSPYTPMATSPDQSRDSQVLSLIDGIGTLNVSNDGRSRFLGLSASSAFFDGDCSDSESLSSTPETSEDLNEAPEHSHPFAFQALMGNSTLDLKFLKSFLPERHEAERLGNVYYTYVFHLYELLTRTEFSALLGEIYNDHRNELCIGRLALLYSIFSLGVLFDPAIPALHPDARKWHDAAETCLKSMDYLSSPSLATVQAIHVMGTYILNSRVDGAEIYWPILGTAMRLCQSMGLHRDGSNWGLETPELESRRRTFHEILSLDRLQSLVLGRPYAISDKHYDTLIPGFLPDKPESHESKLDFSVAKWRFSAYIGRVVDDAFSVSPPSLAVVNRLDEELRQFDRGLPSNLKCSNTTPISQGPIWCDQTQVDHKSGTSTPDDLRLTMQQHFMSALENTTLLFLHRRAFALALSEAAAEPLNSQFSKSVLSVIVESSRNLVIIAQAAQTLYQEIASRWWYMLCHAYNGATCVATLLIKSPGCMLAQHAWSSLSTAMTVFGTASQYGPLCRDLFNRLTRLHKQAVATFSAYTSGEILSNPKLFSMHPCQLSQSVLSPGMNKSRDGSIALSRYLESSKTQLHYTFNEFPCELGASTRLTRKNRTHSLSNSSVASGRGLSLTSSSRSRGTSFGSTDPNDVPSAGLSIASSTNISQQNNSSTSNGRNGSTCSPNHNSGINGTLAASFNRSSWAGLVNSPDDFDDEETNEPPCWENLSVEPGDEPFKTPMFGVPHSQLNNYFEGFSEHFHPPMVLPSNDVMLSPSASNYGTMYGPISNPTSFENSSNHATVNSNFNQSNNQTQDTKSSTEAITSPINTQFDLLDTFLTW